MLRLIHKTAVCCSLPRRTLPELVSFVLLVEGFGDLLDVSARAGLVVIPVGWGAGLGSFAIGQLIVKAVLELSHASGFPQLPPDETDLHHHGDSVRHPVGQYLEDLVTNNITKDEGYREHDGSQNEAQNEDGCTKSILNSPH